MDTQAPTAPKYLIQVRMEVEVDALAWQAEYGTAGDVDDVESYLLTQITQSPAAEAGGYKVTGFAVGTGKF